MLPWCQGVREYFEIWYLRQPTQNDSAIQRKINQNCGWRLCLDPWVVCTRSKSCIQLHSSGVIVTKQNQVYYSRDCSKLKCTMGLAYLEEIMTSMYLICLL